MFRLGRRLVRCFTRTKAVDIKSESESSGYHDARLWIIRSPFGRVKRSRRCLSNGQKLRWIIIKEKIKRHEVKDITLIGQEESAMLAHVAKSYQSRAELCLNCALSLDESIIFYLVSTQDSSQQQAKDAANACAFGCEIMYAIVLLRIPPKHHPSER
eukprot:scaffold9308_cov133-Skeletonema_dohrnii-CCMP3373.AAC.1